MGLAQGSTATDDSVGIGTQVHSIPKYVLRGREVKRRQQKEGRDKKTGIAI